MGASCGANGGGSGVRFRQGKAAWALLNSPSVFSTPAGLDKARAASGFFSGFESFEVFVQSKSFEEFFFQLNSLKIYLAPLP